MKKAVWMVIRDDSFYLSMAIKSVVDYAEGIFVLDTGSAEKDVFRIILGLQKESFPIIYEYKEFGGSKRFDPEYRESEARNYAMDRCLDIFKPDYLVQLDSDEVFNQRFFEIIENMKGDCLAHSTLLPTSPETVSWNEGDCSIWSGIKLFDPHVRSWNANLPVRWVNRIGQHVIPRIEGVRDYLETPNREITTEHVHFHLHRALGPKCIATYICDFKHAYEGASKELNIPFENIFDQKYLEQRWPDWFENGKFKPKKDISIRFKNLSIPIQSSLPKCVLDRWKEWGDWSNWYDSRNCY